MFLHALDAVLACPGDVSAWVQLLVLPCCVLGTFCLRIDLNVGLEGENVANLMEFQVQFLDGGTL